MLLPGTTAGKIDEFETRFTNVRGAHFLIAGNGKEAWPISAAEADAYKALHRRRMIIARWIRRGAILVPILLVLFNIFILPDAPQEVKRGLGTVAALLLVVGIPLAIFQHTVTSDVTRFGIEARLKGRMTTRLHEAITPQLTPAGWWGRRLIFTYVALELGMMALHVLLGKDALAQHMRIMYRMGDGQEDWLARITGNLALILQFVLLLGIVLVIADRRDRRKAGELAKATETRDEARAVLLRQLADEARTASGQDVRETGAVFGRKAAPPSH